MLTARLTFAAPLAALLLLGACSSDSATAPDPAVADDYALAMFGEPAAALDGTLGDAPTRGGAPFDGASASERRLPPALRLTDEQRAEIQALRTAFRAAHQADLQALRAIFEEARAARQDGATREEVQAILATGRPIADRIREAVRQLHEDIQAVLTEAQRAWLRRNRPDIPPMPPAVRPPMGRR